MLFNRPNKPIDILSFISNLADSCKTYLSPEKYLLYLSAITTAPSPEASLSISTVRDDSKS